MVSNKKKDLGNKPGIFGHNQMHYIEIDLFIRMSIHTVLWVTIPSFFLRKFPCCFHHTVVYLPLHKLYRYKWIRSIFFWCSTVSCSVPPLLVVAGGVILFLVIIPIRRVYCNVRVLPTKFVGDIWPINAPDVFSPSCTKFQYHICCLYFPLHPMAFRIQTVVQRNCLLKIYLNLNLRSKTRTLRHAFGKKHPAAN